MSRAVTRIKIEQISIHKGAHDFNINIAHFLGVQEISKRKTQKKSKKE